jgi:hypothetical protein
VKLVFVVGELCEFTDIYLLFSGSHRVLLASYFGWDYILQFHYAVFFAYMRLREQETRNLMWISECVAQNQKSRIHDGIVMTF